MSSKDIAVLEPRKESLDSVVEKPTVTEIKERVNLMHGIHARPSTELSRLLNEYDGTIEMTFRRNNGFYLGSKESCGDPRSVVHIMSCALEEDSEVYFRFTGEKLPEDYKARLHDIFNNLRYNNLLS